MHHRHRFLKTSLLALATLACFGRPAAAETGDRKLYVMKCSKCHKLYDPKDYEDEAWGKWMEKMKKKGRLNDEQYERISRYVETLRKD